MNTNIKYTNQDGNYITSQQVANLKFFNKEFFYNNELKMVQKYGSKGRTNNIILKGGDYYLSSDENLETIINQYASTGNYWTFFYNNQSNNLGDSYWEYLFYNKGELETKGVKVFNSEKLLIASCTIDLKTNEMDDQRKYFYGDLNIYKRNEYEYPFLSVFYDENNDVRDIYIYDDDYQSVDEFLSSDNARYFNWISHPYFHNFAPMLPISSIV
ncbi:hypothetical protein [Flavobacterium sp. Root186]|uniref:hypothetical protein n=1 Tax=Flavobacterium sp. Root186 TaxID=1736485 RepID=UPI0006F6C5CE|nr:hypothetical protein [Flavobacterium sp. Root186]KRB56734.1 hypothetical protein ASD98_08570 [Flavobacterium sp. Root186]